MTINIYEDIYEERERERKRKRERGQMLSS